MDEVTDIRLDKIQEASTDLGGEQKHGQRQRRRQHLYQEGPESTQSAACQAAVAAGGKSPLYNWSAIAQLAGGDDQGFVPDGRRLPLAHSGRCVR